jgi:hypothetical protein
MKRVNLPKVPIFKPKYPPLRLKKWQVRTIDRTAETKIFLIPIISVEDRF